VQEWWEAFLEVWEGVNGEVQEITEGSGGRVFLGVFGAFRGGSSGVKTEARAWYVLWLVEGKIARWKLFGLDSKPSKPPGCGTRRCRRRRRSSNYRRAQRLHPLARQSHGLRLMSRPGSRRRLPPVPVAVGPRPCQLSPAGRAQARRAGPGQVASIASIVPPASAKVVAPELCKQLVDRVLAQRAPKCIGHLQEREERQVRTAASVRARAGAARSTRRGRRSRSLSTGRGATRARRLPLRHQEVAGVALSALLVRLNPRRGRARAPSRAGTSRRRSAATGRRSHGPRVSGRRPPGRR
jgi:hypothetical protein